MASTTKESWIGAGMEFVTLPRHLIVVVLGCLIPSCLCFAVDDGSEHDQFIKQRMHRALEFFRTDVSSHGGYVYQYSADLAKREGEGMVGLDTVWIEPPGTPFVGSAYLKAFQYCGDPLFLDAAKEVANALVSGQLESGGWASQVEFSEESRKFIYYRVRLGQSKEKPVQPVVKKNTTTLDDNKSQSACQFLMTLDQVLNFSDPHIHEAASYALDSFLKAQYSNGAWPQRYDQVSKRSSESSSFRAMIPEDWPRKYPAKKYGSYYTLNDNSISDMIRLMLDAWSIYKKPEYLESAKRGGDFLIQAQLPEPQPGWAQQYDRNMQPTWARRFEPPAVTGGESQAVMKTLLLLYRRLVGHDTEAKKYLAPLPSALRYYRNSLLPDGKLARFYELGTNRPLFLNRSYHLTYDSSDLPTHYSFIINSKLDALQKEYDELLEAGEIALWKPSIVTPPLRSTKLRQRVNEVAQSMDDRGAWVEPGKLKYFGDNDGTKSVIKTTTFCKNILLLAGWLGSQPDGDADERKDEK